MNVRTDIYRQLRLLLTLLMALLMLMPRPGSLTDARASSASLTSTTEVEIRFEGYLKAIGAGKWLIGSQSVLVDSSTTLIEKRGKAEVGAWVIVWATQSENGRIHANTISVERPAGQGGPTYQFSGIVSKQIQEPLALWIVDDLLIKITPQTQLIGEAGVGWLVWVVAEDEGDGLRGIVIEAIAETPEDLPVEFEGTIEAISDNQWRISGQDVFLDTNPLILGTPTINFGAEVRATRDALARWQAHIIRVFGPDDDPIPPRAAAVSNAGTTEWRLNAWKAINPDSISGPWSQPVAIAKGFPDTAKPAIAYDLNGVGHALWAAKGQIYYASQTPGQAWSPAKRIATGSTPVLKADKSGQVHALFHNEFFGNYDIYHLILKDGVWSLPINIARTEGKSLNPGLTVDSAGILRATWMDDTPGYWTVYTGYYDGTFWRNYPAPNARGEDPALAFAPDGTLYLAWQDRVPSATDNMGMFDIFVSQYKNGSWSLPVNVSAQPGVDATGASITTTNDSMAHLTWISGERTIMYCTGQGLYWPAPQIVAQASQAARGPRIVAENGRILHVAWDEVDVVRTTTALPAPPFWPKPEIVAVAAGQLKDVSLAEAPGSGITLGWADISLPNDAGVYASAQTAAGSNLPVRAWLPLVTTH